MRPRIGLRDQELRRQLHPLLLGRELRADLPRAEAARRSRADRGHRRPHRRAAAHRLRADRRGPQGAAASGTSAPAEVFELPRRGPAEALPRRRRRPGAGAPRSRASAPRAPAEIADAPARGRGPRRGQGPGRPTRCCASGSPSTTSWPSGSSETARELERDGAGQGRRAPRRKEELMFDALAWLAQHRSKWRRGRRPSSSSASPARSAARSPTSSTPTAPTTPTPRASSPASGSRTPASATRA